MLVYSTKYALTKGIEEVDAEETSYNSMVTYDKYFNLHGEGREWHRTLEGALEKAEEMRIMAIYALDRKRHKLSAIDFEKQFNKSKEK